MRLKGCAELEPADRPGAFASAAASRRAAVRPLELHVATQHVRATVGALDRTLTRALGDGRHALAESRALLDALWRAARETAAARLPHAPLVQRVWRACARGLLASLRRAMVRGDPARLPAPAALPAFVAHATAAQIAAVAAEMRLLLDKDGEDDDEEEDDEETVHLETGRTASTRKGDEQMAPFERFDVDTDASADLQAAYDAMLGATGGNGMAADLERTEEELRAVDARIDAFLEDDDARRSGNEEQDVDATMAAFEREVVQTRVRVCREARAALVAAEVPEYLAMVGRVALMRAGDLAGAFVAALERLLDAYRGPYWPTLARVQACLADAQRACGPAPFAACVRLRLSARHARNSETAAVGPFTPLDITCLDFFRLDLALPSCCDGEGESGAAPVLRAVVPVAVRRRCARVWHFLLRLKWARAALDGTWALFTGARARARGDARLHALLLARYAMDRVVRALEQYFTTCAVAVPWQRFLAQVVHLTAEGEAVLPLTALVRRQDECLRRIETQCFLTTPLRAVRRLLDGVFSCAVQFCAQSAAILEGAERASAAEHAQCLDRALACADHTRAALARHTAVLRELLASLTRDPGHRCDHPRLPFLLDALSE